MPSILTMTTDSDCNDDECGDEEQTDKLAGVLISAGSTHNSRPPSAAAAIIAFRYV
jgi:hypothetical protein